MLVKVWFDMRQLGRTIATLAPLCLCACQTPVDPALPRGAQAYKLIEPPVAAGVVPEYSIGPLDVVSIRVFQEPELTFERVAVDASGSINYPLIGNVQASGLSASALSQEISAKLREKYLVKPQVSVTIISSVAQQVTVEGNVTQPGVYDILGGATLLDALARAQSPTRVARLNEIVIFRTVNGQRMGGVFDLNAIRAGSVPDPKLQGGDKIVVGYSFVKGAFRDLLTTVPLFNLFRNF